MSLSQRELIITEITSSIYRDIKTSTIKHVLECTGETHRILAKLVDVYPKELSKVYVQIHRLAWGRGGGYWGT